MTVWIGAAGALSGQNAPSNTLVTLEENAAQRTAEWNTLTTNLERRLTRLLPCDARVRTSIDEVSRASEARTLALTSYWTMLSAKSRVQLDGVRALLAEEQERATDWAKDQTDAQVDVAVTDAQIASLTPGIRQLPALANPQKSLETVAQLYRSLQAQAQARAAAAGPLAERLGELLAAAQARQAAIEARLKSLSAEGVRWSGYYAARLEREQIECSITSGTAAAGFAMPPRAGRPAAPGRKQ